VSAALKLKSKLIGATRYWRSFWLPLGRTASEVISSTCAPEGETFNWVAVIENRRAKALCAVIRRNIEVQRFFRNSIDAYPLVQGPLNAGNSGKRRGAGRRIRSEKPLLLELLIKLGIRIRRTWIPGRDGFTRTD